MKRWMLSLIAAVALTATAHAETYISGFVEATQAFRVQKNMVLDNGLDLTERAYPRADLRAQLKLSGGGDRDEYFVRVDFLSDQAGSPASTIDVREAFLKLYATSWLNIKVGRQVATWGTGDLLFANDLFAKDWVAFFTGMDLAYLKPPQDLLRVGFYAGSTTIEVAASPYFTSDNLPTGERLSIYSPFAGQVVDSDNAATVQSRPQNLKNAELFTRISGYWGAREWALYGYRGYFPQPLGAMITATGPELYAPRLSSAGASIRGSLGSYLVNLEGAFYYSEEDKDGDNPMLPNSSAKLLAGVEKSLGNELTAGAQWFGDWMMDYDKYEQPFIASGAEPMSDELRHTVTLRLTKFLRYQTIKLSFFGYWGISDEDVYLRPSIDYSFSDAVKITLGANWLDGNKPYTMFGQFQNNSNAYARMRYSF